LGLYKTCLHCKKSFTKPSKRRYCSVLCKSAVAKQQAKQRLADDRYWLTVGKQPTFNLTDKECYRLEARIGSVEHHVFDGRGYSVRKAQKEKGSANANGLHEPWANKGADLDVWEIRRKDRLRYGGIVMTAEQAVVLEKVKAEIGASVQLPDYHLKVWPPDLEKRLKSYLESSDLPYDKDLLNIA
jgi:hypothetical protein